MKSKPEQQEAKVLAKAMEILRRYGQDHIANLIEPILDNLSE